MGSHWRSGVGGDQWGAAGRAGPPSTCFPATRMVTQASLILFLALFSGVLTQNKDDAPVRLKCYECATDGCVTNDDLGIEKTCPQESEVCFVGVGGGKVYRKCGLTNEVRAECVDTTTRTGEPLEACYCHGDLCNSGEQLSSSILFLTAAIGMLHLSL